MTMQAFLGSVQRQLSDAFRTWGPRAAWCRKQRRLLSAADGRVVWVRGESASWATWGAHRGYFEVQFMDGLPYLRAIGAPTT